MAKGKSTWKYNKLLTGRRNYFDGTDSSILERQTPSWYITSSSPSPTNNMGIVVGGYTNNPTIIQPGTSTIKDVVSQIGTSSPSTSKFELSDLGKKVLKGAGVAAAQIGGGLIGGGLQSGAGTAIQGLTPLTAALPPGIREAASAGLGLVGGLANRMFGSKLNQENIAKVENNINELNSFQSNALDFDTLSQNWSNAVTGLTFDDDYIGKDGWFSNKASNKAKDLRNKISIGNTWVQNTLANNANNITNTQMQNLLGNYAAFGGELNTQGGDFTNGILAINAGGSHETNPYEGIQMGVDPQGVPNLVEEGETIFNDYVFSNRLTVPKAIRNKYKLRGNKPLTFAEASKILAKESEERPNDPISIKGLEAMMMDLASAQERLKSEENNQYSQGGRLFAKGGQSYTYNNTSNDTSIPNYSLFSPYFSNGQFNFDAMHSDGSEYRKRLDPIAAALYKRKQDSNYKYTDQETKYLTDYMNSVNTWNPNKKYSSINDLTYDRIIGDSLTTNDGNSFTYNPNAEKKGLALDKKRGGHYYGVGAVNIDPKKAAIDRYFEYGTGKEIKDFTTERNKVGKTWFDLNPDYYLVDKKGTVRDPVDIDGVSTTYTDYFLRKRETEEKEKEEAEKEWEKGKYYEWLRYAPTLGFGLGTLTDVFGLTNTPDYSDANAILEATRGAGNYQPVSYRPIGDYLTYRPFDRDYYINSMNAEANAARRSLLNTSGGNRGTAMAGILAADNNALNQIGTLARQAEEYNLAQREKVADFNRNTNITNSEGFLKADMANQSALANQREFNLKGIMAAAEMREKERLAADEARSANISGLFESLGNMGYEEANRRMLDYTLAHELWGTGAEDGYIWNRGRKVERDNTNSTNKSAKGGKLNKKKGLTF